MFRKTAPRFYGLSSGASLRAAFLHFLVMIGVFHG